MAETDTDAIASAVADATKEAGVDLGAPEKGAPAPEPETTTDKVDTTAKVEAPKADESEEEELFDPTAEELALIDKSPELKKVYRSMQKGLTQKSQRYADLVKQHSDEVQVARWVQQNPKEAARALAASTGMSISEAKEAVAAAASGTAPVVDELQELWDKTVGKEAAALLRPVIEKTAERIAQSRIAPFQQQTEQLAQAAVERGIAASLREFAAGVTEQGSDFDDEIQGEMAKILDSISPNDDTPIEQVLNIAYNAASATRERGRTAKANLARLKAARTESEPSNAGRPASRVEHQITLGMSDRDAVEMAVAMAHADLKRG